MIDIIGLTKVNNGIYKLILQSNPHINIEILLFEDDLKHITDLIKKYIKE